MRLSLCLFLASILVAAEPFDMSRLQEDHLMNKILKHEKYCVQSYEKGKIFLHPSKLSFSTQKPMLDLNGQELVPLPALRVDDTGCFLEHGFSDLFDRRLHQEECEQKLCSTCLEPVDTANQCQNSKCLFYSFVVETSAALMIPPPTNQPNLGDPPFPIALYVDNAAIGFPNTAPPIDGLIVSGNVSIGANSASSLFNVGTSNQFQVNSSGVASAPQYNLNGSTSGTISILSQAITGSYNFNLPTDAGLSGYFLTSSGGGAAAMTWTDPSASLVTSITGTANQISASSSVGNVTLALTNGINIGSYQAMSPQIGGIICPGDVGIGTPLPKANTLTIEKSITTEMGLYLRNTEPATDHYWLLSNNGSLSAGSPNGGFSIMRFNASNVFQTAVLNITTSDFVGIGTSAPDNKFHVLKGSAGAVTADANQVLVVENNTTGYMAILTPDANERGLCFGETSSVFAGGIYYNTAAVLDGLSFRTNGNQQRMAITSSGNCGIGTTNPSGLLQVSNPTAAFFHLQDTGAAANQQLMQLRTDDNVTKFRSLNDTGSGVIQDNILAMIHSTGGVGIGTTTITTNTRLQINGVKPGITTGSGITVIEDTTALAANNGGSLVFRGIFTGAGASAGYAAIQAAKTNATDGNLDTSLVFYSRNSAGGILEGLRISNNQFVGIGDTAPGSRLSVIGNAQIGFASGTAAPINGMLVSGNVGIGTTVIGGALSVSLSQVIDSPPTPAHQISVNPIYTVTGAASTSIESIRAIPNFDCTNGNLTGSYSAIVGMPLARGNNTISNVIAVSGNVRMGGSTAVTVTNGSSFTANSWHLVSNSTVSNYRGFQTGNVTWTDATNLITNYYHFFGTNVTGAGVVTNQYGLFLQNMTKGTTLNYAIYSEGGRSYHAGNFGIADTAPGSSLSVVGNTQIGFASGTAAPVNGLFVNGNTSIGASSNTYKFEVTGGEIACRTLGNGFRVAEGANARMGTAVLNGGTPATVTVNTTAVTANSRIFITGQTLGTITVGAAYSVSARTAGTSFTITSSAATDTSTVAWIIFEPS